MQVAYFVHDVHDAAVARRVQLLQAGGAVVRVLGFRRRDDVRKEIQGAPVFDLGRTADAALKARARLVGMTAFTAKRLGDALRGTELVVARSLELLLVAASARDANRLKAPLVYECVDIHRLMVSDGLAGRLLRSVERRLLNKVSLLVTTSPAFRDRYFHARQKCYPQTVVVENKLYLSQKCQGLSLRSKGPPWRIGWYGMIRCRRSLDLLCELAKRLDGVVEVCIAGRPSLTEFQDFYGQIEASPHVHYLGPYEATDLERLYKSVHFSWDVDFFEAGANSDWLLPNRLYEGGAFGAVPIALAAVETGRWMASRNIGVRIEGDDVMAELVDFFSGLVAEQYETLAGAMAAIPQAAFIMTDQDGEALVNLFRSLESQ